MCRSKKESRARRRSDAKTAQRTAFSVVFTLPFDASSRGKAKGGAAQAAGMGFLSYCVKMMKDAQSGICNKHGSEPGKAKTRGNSPNSPKCPNRRGKEEDPYSK